VADVTHPLIGVDFLPFRPPGGLPKQPPTGRSRFVVCTGPSGKLADPQRQDHHWRHTGRQPPRRIPGPHSPSRSPARSAPQHLPSLPDYTRPTGHMPATATPPDRLAMVKAESTPCCGTAQLATQRVPCLPLYVLCPKRTMVGVHAATTEL
jgi:hypothetical protein